MNLTSPDTFRLIFGAQLFSLALSNLSATEKPNIIFILGDDQAWWDYSFMYRNDVEGPAFDSSVPKNHTIYPAAQTPAIDQLADEGLAFTHGYTVPLCRPSLQAMITGTFPHQNRISGNDMVGKVDDEAADQRILFDQSIARTLVKRYGYRAYQTGKWWGGHHSLGGFTEGDTQDSAAAGTNPPQYTGSRPGYANQGRHGDWGLMIGRVDYINDIQNPAHPINYADTIVPLTDFIDDCVANDDPFFAWYAPFLPHTPHDPPTGLRNKYDALIDEPDESGNYHAKYYANIERLDGGIAAILDHLDAKGIADNTMIIFICDNGWVNLDDRSHHTSTSKRSPREAGARTPIIVHWPRAIKPGGPIEPQIVTQPVSVIDMVPTALAAVDLEPSAEQHGINLMDLDAVNTRDTIYCDVYAHDMASLEDPSASIVARYVVKDGWKLIDYDGSPAELYHLYDTTTGNPVDPFEINDLSGVEPAKLSALSTLIDTWYNEPKEMVWSTSTSQTNATDTLPIPGELGQSFTVSGDGFLTGVNLPFEQSDPAESITVELRQLDGSGAPLGALIAGTTIHPDPVYQAGFRWSLFQFDTPVPVTDGQQLGFLVKSSSQPNTGFYVAYNDSGGYPGGAMYYSGQIGDLTWDSANLDLPFQIFTSIYPNRSNTRIIRDGNGVTVSADLGVKGQPAVIETSTDLSHGSWISAATDDNLDGLVALNETALVNRKFYRFGLSTIGDPFSIDNPPAGLTVTNSEAASFTVSNTDLLQTAFDSYNGSPLDDAPGGTDTTYLQGLTPSGEASLRDGVWFSNENSRGSAMVQNDEFAVFNLDLTASPGGYNIDQIDLYSNWGTGDGRDEIKVTITMSLVGTPTVFDQTVVTNEAYNPPTETQGKMSITGIGASGIAAIRFDWPGAQENNGVGYSEIDVFGSPTP
ncbi:sulfatase [Haloferula chungangensis]|uniref:Sulfatase n=1 Tax=Haloferula chungangensis TaxID=1048331 RepID=A0ABW2L0X9_9BACT